MNRYAWETRIAHLTVASCVFSAAFCLLVCGCVSLKEHQSGRAVLANAIDQWEAHRQPIPADSNLRKYVKVRSELLSVFWGREMFLEAEVIVPPGHDSGERLPVCYFIHGFTNWELWAFRLSDEVIENLNDSAEDYPRMVYVFPNAQFGLGHHVFADSAANGPWGEAFVTELVPAIETQFGGVGEAEGRFLSGHSSGAWSALWLQIMYPNSFGGAWAMAPDPVDFRSFTGVNIYEDENAFIDDEGNERMLVRNRNGWVQSFRGITQTEAEKGPFAGQFASFDNVFSPLGQDGLSRRLYNWETGVIDREVAEAWKAYDISLILRTNWQRLAPKLSGKLHIYAGTLDNFRLNEAVDLLKSELDELNADAEIVIVPGAGHSIFRPHPDFWPEGLVEKIHREMAHHEVP